MEILKPALLFFLLPFVLVTLVCYLVDKDGSKTGRLLRKPKKMSQKLYDNLVKQRLSIQFLLTLFAVLVMTILAVKVKMPVWAFYLVCGVLVGLINSLGLALERGKNR